MLSLTQDGSNEDQLMINGQRGFAYLPLALFGAHLSCTLASVCCQVGLRRRAFGYAFGPAI